MVKDVPWWLVKSRHRWDSVLLCFFDIKFLRSSWCWGINNMNLSASLTPNSTPWQSYRDSSFKSIGKNWNHLKTNSSQVRRSFLKAQASLETAMTAFISFRLFNDKQIFSYAGWGKTRHLEVGKPKNNRIEKKNQRSKMQKVEVFWEVCCVFMIIFRDCTT